MTPQKQTIKQESSPKDGTWWDPHEALPLNRGSDRYWPIFLARKEIRVWGKRKTGSYGWAMWKTNPATLMWHQIHLIGDYGRWGCEERAMTQNRFFRCVTCLPHLGTLPTYNGQFTRIRLTDLLRPCCFDLNHSNQGPHCLAQPPKRRKKIKIKIKIIISSG